MTKQIPRVLVAGSSSGCGKTTITCGILAALQEKGLSLSALKCGPDYIDPAFHRAVLGVPGGNLDPFFCGEGLLRCLLAQNAPHGELVVMEGVMGYYDGIFSPEASDPGLCCSSYQVAAATGTPVVLVVDGKGASTSILAVIQGFLDFVPDAGIRGIILNRVTAHTYENLRKLAAERFGERAVMLGYLPRLPEECILGSRHLGLVTAEEVRGLRGKLQKIAGLLRETVDLDALVQLAGDAPPLAYEPQRAVKAESFTLAVARDKAFCFYYPDNFRLLEEMGARLRFFSPLADEPVPADADGLYLGGGYPELHLDALSGNRRSLGSIREAVEGGMPTIAECGGFMVLGRSMAGTPMCGVLPGESFDQKKLCRFGYLTLTSRKEGLFGPAGTQIKGHEFHYWDCTQNGADFSARKAGGAEYLCGVSTGTLYAGYPHLYLASCPEAAAAFCQKCAQYKREKQK